MMLRQFAVTALDTVAAAGVLWVLLPSGAISYLAPSCRSSPWRWCSASSATCPAGLGVFEAVLLAALGGVAPPAELLAAFALYRLIYQVVPLGARRGRADARRGPPLHRARAGGGGAARRWPGWRRRRWRRWRWSSARCWSSPASRRRAASTSRGSSSFLPLPLIEGAHFLATVLGALLMISARGLAFRLDGAWWTALVAACAALVLSLVKAVAIYEAGALALFAVALLVSRHEFDRTLALLAPRLTPPWIAAVAVVLISALVILRFVFGHAEFGAESWLRFEISAEAPRGLRALFGASLLAGLVAIWSLLRPARQPADAASPQDLARAVAIVEAQPVAAANLVRMGDKRLIFSDDGRGFVMYGRQGDARGSRSSTRSGRSSSGRS